jgi:peptide/nickel transport system ATP-binding protein
VSEHSEVIPLPAGTAPGAGSLVVEGLSITFSSGGHRAGDRPAVSGLSFTLEPGRILALVGESGSGKSVSAMATLGLLPATATVSGSIRLDGEELVGATSERLRAVRGGAIGTIFQEPTTAFNPVFTIGSQIAEALHTHTELDRHEVRSRVLELLASVGLDDPQRVSSSYPHQLSGGQTQRAMIAMAISCDPHVLVADEPTTALDVTVQAGILELLRDLRDRLDMAILLITHDMGVVADVADDVVVLRDGEVVERADVTTLFADPQADYTRALLDAVPELSDIDDAAVSFDGASPAVTSLPPRRPGIGDAVAADLTDVSVDYAGRRRSVVHAVDDVTLEIHAGETLGLVGESGSGKSTIGRALAGLAPIVGGTVVVAGHDVSRATRNQWKDVRRSLGIVFQDPASSLNPRQTVGTSIAEPIVVHHRDRRGDLDRRVAGLLEQVQLPARMAERYPHEMSGGQRQRVAIARAIALDPDLLIADEPTSALDVSVQARILDLFRELQERIGFACLFISHDLAVVEQLADRVAVMQNGHIVEEGTTARVLQSPRNPYTRRLLAAAPVADPARQRLRREAWRELAG